MLRTLYTFQSNADVFALIFSAPRDNCDYALLGVENVHETTTV